MSIYNMNRIRAVLTAIGLLGITALLTAQQLTTRTGPLASPDGATPVLRSTRQGAVAVQFVAGKYSEAILRGNVYVGATPAAGATPGTALSSAPVITVWNPLNSGRTLRLVRSSTSYISGTLGAGTLVYGLSTGSSGTAPSGGTAITAVNALLGSANSSVALCRTGATNLGTLIMGEPIASVFPELATTANGIQTVTDDLDGRYLIQPGNGVSITFIGTAGTSPLLAASVSWEELIQGQEG